MRLNPVREDRSIFSYLFLTFITCGIYGIWFLHQWIKDINRMCEDDGRHTEGIVLYCLLSLVTCGIYSFFWWFKVGERLYRNSIKEGVHSDISGMKLVLCFLLGAVTCSFCSWYAINLAMKATNELATAYNQKYVYNMAVIDANSDEN